VYDTYIQKYNGPKGDLIWNEETTLSDGSKLQVYKDIIEETDTKTSKVTTTTKLYLFKFSKEGELVAGRIFTDNLSFGIKHHANLTFITEVDDRLKIAYEKMAKRPEISKNAIEESLFILDLDSKDLSGDIIENVNIHMHNMGSFFVDESKLLLLGYERVDTGVTEVSRKTLYSIEF